MAKGLQGRAWCRIREVPLASRTRSLARTIGLVAACSGCATTTAPPPNQARPAAQRSLPAATKARVDAVRQLVVKYARRHDVPESLVLAVISVESSFRPEVQSPAGAVGLMQLMPRTAASLAARLGRDSYDLSDPDFNIDAGTAYLAYLLKRFGELDPALAAYNAGPSRISRLKRAGVALPSYSRRYIAAVRSAEAYFTGLSKTAPPLEQTVSIDRDALKRLLRDQLYGPREDEALPDA